jgi:hypothetical protein
MICGCVEKAGFVGTARKSLRWESIAIQSIAGVKSRLKILLSQWRSQVPKTYLQSPIHSW